MKNVKAFLYLFVAFFSLFCTREADAFFIKKVLAMPQAATTKITTVAVNIMNSTVVITTVSTVKTGLETVKIVKEVSGTNFENADDVSKLLTTLDTKFDGSAKLNKVAKKITKSKTADIYDEKAVSNAVYKMFLVEPSKKGGEIACYTKQRDNFYKDTIAELYTVVREVENSVPALIKELDATEELLKNGGGAVGDLDSNTVALDVTYQSSELLDKVVKMTEELTAIQLQFEMASAMKNSILPLTKEEADEIKKQNKLNKKENKKKAKEEKSTTSSLWQGNKYSSRSELAFAQLSAVEEEEFDLNDFTTFPTKAAPAPEIKSPFEGSEANLDAVKNLYDLRDELSDAMAMHNVSTTLLSYKDVFEEYEDMKKLHAKSLETLAKSDQCSINYLSKYYDNPEQVWSGGYLGALANQETLRKGFSKWLIDSYDVAKSQMVSDVAVENTVTATIDSSIDIKNMEQGSKDSEKHVKSQKLENTFSASELSEYEESGRDVNMLPWKIGANLSRDLALDQYGENKWGKVKKPFPLWNDQKKFYDLYIDSKYNNIIEYFNFADLRDIELGIARGINKENGEEAEKEYQTQANKKNGKWYTNLQNAASQAKFKGEEDDAEWYLDVKNKILGMEENQKDLAERKARLKKQTQTKAVILELADITENERWLNGFKTKMTDVASSEELGKALSSEVEKARKKEENPENKADGVFALYDEDILKILAEKEKAILPLKTLNEQKNEQLKNVKAKISDYNKTINNVEEEKLEAKENETEYESKINVSSLNLKIEEQKKNKEKLEKEISDRVTKIDDLNRQYDKKLADKEQELQKDLTLISESFKDNKKTSINDILNQGLKSSLAKKAASASTMIANLARANALLSEIRGYAADTVLRTRNKIFELGEDLYYPASNQLVVKEHGKMVDELKSISFDKFSSFATNLNVSTSLLQIASEAINQHLMSKVCKDDKCLLPDEDYFVGIVSKARDFNAPKEPFLEYLPPVREAFYFDGNNFSNLFNDKNFVDVKMTCDEMRASGDIVSDVKVVAEYIKDAKNPLGLSRLVQMCKFKKYYVSKTQFLDSEIYLPQVWKRVLTGRAFVERDISLKDFLSQDAKQSSAANADLMRGGRYPCLLSGVVIDVSDEAKYFISTAKFENLPTCQDVTLDKKAYYYNIRDIEEDISTSIGNGVSKPRFEASELGFIFSSGDEGYLFLKNTVRSIFQRLQELDKLQEEGKEYNATIKDVIYGNSQLNINQFGDFLSVSEQEKNYRKSVEELKISVDELKETLFTALRKAGFEPQEDLNLANASDYELVKKTLHNKKIQIISDVSRKMKNYDMLLDVVVGERKEEIKNISNALLQDNEEMISLSMSLPTSTELAEQIKTEKANLKVREAQKKQAQKAFQEQLDKMIRPYCASY